MMTPARPFKGQLLPALAAFSLSLLVACGGGSAAGGGHSQGGQQQEPQKPIQLATGGVAVVKVRAEGGAWVAMAETQTVLGANQPDRRLLFPRAGSDPLTYLPPQGWSLLDFTQHPSREVTAVLGTDHAVKLLRFDATGKLLREQDFTDPASPSDPFMDDPIYIRSRTSLLPYLTRDAARLAPLGEDAVLVLRTGMDAVVAYRLAHGDGGFSQRWRTLVEPGAMLGARAIIGGGFDPFNSLVNPAHVSVDVSVAGRIAVAVQNDMSGLAEAHAAYFKEEVPRDMLYGLFVTEIDSAGVRLGARIAPMSVRPEIHTVRWLGDTIAVAGRQMTSRPANGAGWDAFVSLLKPGKAPATQVIDVDRCDIIFDLMPLADGRILASGTTGYVQNPGGASISEESQPLLAVLDAQGALQQRLGFTAGPRQNQVRSLAALNGGWLAGGLVNGPGTHSGDGNPAAIFADGYLREGRL
ncbi:hypothetical protein [Massilia endophytica]|uniref:hypothetical protein n=1 Tax=Massilia endophytica TaxID=2899220 RepID=UPI001E5DA116|nr:hypothetical protein [Massilia endophytica]UGQ47737.1 hypothetical protein LSQ66_04485 [Massilia endophytica]